MAILVPGRVCRKVVGKNAGAYCVVVERAGKKRVVIDGPRIKRKVVATSQLEPLPLVLPNVSKDTDSKILAEKLKKEGYE